MIHFFKQRKDKKVINKIYKFFDKDIWVNGKINSKFEIKIKNS